MRHVKIPYFTNEEKKAYVDNFFSMAGQITEDAFDEEEIAVILEQAKIIAFSYACTVASGITLAVIGTMESPTAVGIAAAITGSKCVVSCIRTFAQNSQRCYAIAIGSTQRHAFGRKE
jgi:hypothetical protein